MASPPCGASTAAVSITVRTNGWAVAELQTEPALAVAARRSAGEIGFNPQDYDLSADGQTFVVVAPAGREAEVLVAVNWSEELSRSLRGRE